MAEIKRRAEANKKLYENDPVFRAQIDAEADAEKQAIEQAEILRKISTTPTKQKPRYRDPADGGEFTV